MPTIDDFKQKYAPVFALMEKGGVRLDHLHVQDDKMVMTGAACSEDLRNAVWNAVKGVDASYADTSIQIDIDTSLPCPPAEAPAGQTYTVVAGDSLWKIAHKFYGNGAEFKKIIAANPDKLEDENSVIHPGDELTIPA